VLRGEFGEGGAAVEDLLSELPEARDGVDARGGGDDPALGVLPGGLAAGALVLDQDRGPLGRDPAARMAGRWREGDRGGWGYGR
jgi:hypothetical protein